MKAKLFTKAGCPHCESLKIPNGVNVINVMADDYQANAFVPNQVPMLQFGDVVLVGPQHIQDYFDSAKLIN